MSIRLFLEQSITRSYSFLNRWQIGLSILIQILLTPLSWLYTSVIFIRNILYDIGWFKPKILSGQVVSIGNITVGGTGKTPHVVYLAQLLEQKGFRVAVLTAGYRAKLNKQVVIVSDKTPVSICGDESLMIYRQLAINRSTSEIKIPVLTCRNRYRAGLQAIRQFQSEVFIVDDGFQHRQLARSIDIVLLKNENQLNPKLLPAGPLREPLRNLKRADIIIRSSAGESETSVNLVTNQPTFSSYYRPTRLYPIHQPELKIALEKIKGSRILAFCGIGNPSGFNQLLQKLEPATLHLMVFADHHQYDVTDLHRIYQDSVSFSADLIVTTEKDQPKIRSCPSQPTIHVVAIEPVISDEFGQLVDFMLRKREGESDFFRN